MTPTQTLLAQIRKPEFLEAVRGAVPHLVPNGELSLASAVLVAICTKMDTWPPTGNEAARRASEDAQLWYDMQEAILRAEMPLPKVKTKLPIPPPPIIPPFPPTTPPCDH